MKATFKRELIGNEGLLLLDTIRRLNRRNAIDHLLKLVQKTHPADIAWVFRHLNPEERKNIFNIIAQTDLVGEFLSELDLAIMNELVSNLTPKFMVAIIKKMASDDAADLLEALPEELSNEIRRMMGKEDRDEVDKLLQYHPESAGGLMSPDFMSLDEELSVGDAIKKVQERSEEMEMSFYLYITHGAGQLAGVLSLRELLMHPPYRLLKNIMNPKVIAVTTDTNQSEVAHIVSQYDFLALPVVDTNYKLVGIITVDDIIDVIREEATEEFLQMAGAGKDREILLKPVMQNAMIRAPWLMATWVGGVMNSFIISSFQEELSRVLALAAFIPIIAGMGGSIANQSSTIVVRGIATGRINLQDVTKLLFKEMRVGLFLGGLFGLLLGFIAYFSHQEVVNLGIAVGSAILLAMTIAVTIGTIMPVLLRRLGIDAAVATVPFVSTTMDIISVTSYFLIAKYLLDI